MGRRGEVVDRVGMRRTLSGSYSEGPQYSYGPNPVNSTYIGKKEDYLILSENLANAEISAESLIPTGDQDIKNIFDLDDPIDFQVGTIAKLVLDGYAGVGSLTFDGYDYFHRPREETDQKDRIAGQYIGKLLSAAAAKGVDTMIYVYTAGGVASLSEESDNDLPLWSNNDGGKSGIPQKKWTAFTAQRDYSQTGQG